MIQDGGYAGGTAGSLSKIGTATLTLTKASIYTGGTTVSDGILLVKNTTGSGTGTAPVAVNAGTLGGTGKIAGPVTFGTGTGSGAVLSPGVNAPGMLTINKPVIFNADATYKCELKLVTPRRIK